MTMCRASVPSSRRGSHRAVRPLVGDGDIRLVDAKRAAAVALHEENNENKANKVAAASKPRERPRPPPRTPPSSEGSSPPRRAFFVGGDVRDDYDVLLDEELGRGQYGTVRSCVHRATRKAFACKSVDKSKIRRPDHVRNEVELLSEIDHRGIVRMVDCYEDDRCVHIVTERCTGGELFDKIVERTTDKGCFSEEKAAAIVESLLEAIAYLHSRDIVHRDLKPENILFATKDEKDAKLIDFGLSRRHREGDPPMTNPVGTAYYMAPELLDCRYDRSCDLWSVGTIAYILMSGAPPFNGDDDPSIFDAIRYGPLRFPAQQWSNKSDQAMGLIRSLLRRDPKERPTAEEALRHPWFEHRRRKRRTRAGLRRRRESLQSALQNLFIF